jgi:hypothetical protein
MDDRQSRSSAPAGADYSFPATVAQLFQSTGSVADAAADTLLVLALALSGEDCEALAADASVRRRARDEALDTGRLDREWLSQLLVGDGARRNAYSLAIGLDAVRG